MMEATTDALGNDPNAATIIADLQGTLQSRTGTDPAASQW